MRDAVASRVVAAADSLRNHMKGHQLIVRITPCTDSFYKKEYVLVSIAALPGDFIRDIPSEWEGAEVILRNIWQVGPPRMDEDGKLL